jgi:hypothetical protein
VKKVQRWLRGLVFRPGNPDNVHEFMTALGDVPDLVEKGPLARELEFCSQHFYSHLMHGLEVVAYRHPDDTFRNKAFLLFAGMCLLLHLLPESTSAFEKRLCTREWPNGHTPKDYVEVAIDVGKELP